MTQSQWAEPVDQALRNITVTPERYAAADVDRYAAADDSRYAAVASDRYRYAAAPKEDRYSSVPRYPSRRYSSRYLSLDRYAKSATGVMKLKRIIIAPPSARQPRTDEQLLWIPCSEFEQCFEEWEPDEIWGLGNIVNFDDARECLRWQGYDEDDQLDICTITVDSERDTFLADDWCEQVGAMPFDQAFALREALASKPQQTAEALEPWDLMRIGDVLGGNAPAMPGDIADAIANDPMSGLGAVALDHLVWRTPEKFGAPGARLEETLKQLGEEEYLRLGPVENFLLYVGSLHPGTVARPPIQRWNKTLYPMTGCYVVSKISYHSDPEGTVVGGWRSCWLEPTETPPPYVPPPWRR